MVKMVKIRPICGHIGDGRILGLVHYAVFAPYSNPTGQAKQATQASGLSLPHISMVLLTARMP